VLSDEIDVHNLTLKKMIEVIIADDSATFRRALSTLLASLDDIRVVAEAKNGKQAVKLAFRLIPRVILMDIGMPALNGLRATRQITDHSAKTKVLILSAHSDVEYVEEAIRCGAQGYLVKNSVPGILAKAIRQLNDGRIYFNPPISSRLRIQCRDLSAKAAVLRGKKIDSVA
jgi:DNA-binding NarL/FixJ family response regulator